MAIVYNRHHAIMSWEYRFSYGKRKELNMIDPLIKVFAETLRVSPEQLSDSTSPENTPPWDSVAAMDLVAAVEDGFNVELTTKEIMKMRSIGLVREVLRSKGVAC